jgi:AraC-like DNA-binding protein
MPTRATTTNDARTVLKSYEHGETRWQIASRPTPAVLRRSVRQLAGYTEQTNGGLSRFEVPRPWVVVILELGPPIRVHDPNDQARAIQHSGGFVAGLDDRVTLTTHDGYQAGIELNLCPVAARRLFATPMSAVSGRVIALDDLLSRDDRGLTARLAELPDWDARLDLIEAMLGERLTATPAPQARIVSWACRRIRHEPGLDQKSLAKELGYSQKHVITLFKEHVGVTPKQFARMVRFDRLVQYLRAGGRAPWAELAPRFGWFDQAHLAGDLRRFLGASPSQARELLGLPEGMEVNFFQDLPHPDP